MYRSLVFICLCVAFLCSSCGQTAPVHDSRFQTEDYLIDYDVSPEYVNAEGTFCRYESTYYDIIGQWILYYDAAGGQQKSVCGIYTRMTFPNNKSSRFGVQRNHGRQTTYRSGIMRFIF